MLVMRHKTGFAVALQHFMDAWTRITLSGYIFKSALPSQALHSLHHPILLLPVMELNGKDVKCRYASGDKVESWLLELLCLDAAKHKPISE